MAVIGSLQDIFKRAFRNGTSGDDTVIAVSIESGSGSAQTVKSNQLASTGLNSEITIGASAVEVKVGGSRYVGRQLVTVQPRSGLIYLGFSSSVTTATGIELAKGLIYNIDCSDTGEIWVIAPVAGRTVRIGEAK
jgi:hypothetical protein